MIPGHTNNPNGRPKGIANKRNQQIAEYADEKEVNPGKILVKILAGEITKLGGEDLKKEDFRWAIDTLMPYLYGKRKPIDSEGNDQGISIMDVLSQLHD